MVEREEALDAQVIAAEYPLVHLLAILVELFYRLRHGFSFRPLEGHSAS